MRSPHERNPDVAHGCAVPPCAYGARSRATTGDRKEDPDLAAQLQGGTAQPYATSGWFAVSVLALVLSSSPLVAQNPLARDADAATAGRATYLERCAVCHGQDATGSMAINLLRSRTVARGTDAALFQVIWKGFPGTEMPPQPDLQPEKIWQLVTYLHSRARPGLQPPLPRDAEAGRKVFETAGCANCHRVGGEGGFLGPPLDSIAARRTSERIRRDVLEPDVDIPEGYRQITAITHDGDRITGLEKNSDTFSLQIMTRDGQYRLINRGDIAKVEPQNKSPMPSGYEQKLSAKQLENLFAYLDRQRDSFIPIPGSFRNY